MSSARIHCSERRPSTVNSAELSTLLGVNHFYSLKMKLRIRDVKCVSLKARPYSCSVGDAHRKEGVRLRDFYVYINR